VITIDDGDRSFVRYAIPELRRRGQVATLFLLSGHVGEEDWNDLDFVGWETLRALQDEGVIRVESHTHRLHTKQDTERGPRPRFLVAAEQAPERLAEDLAASRNAIRRELGHDATLLAWPFGYSNATVDSIAHEAGFRRTFSLRPRRIGFGSDDPAALGRYAVTARTSFRVFRLMLEPPGPDSGGGLSAAAW
jgi:peptidoglycan/xylan/chitin deacetylase (PgdA/CDA1 family)